MANKWKYECDCHNCEMVKFIDDPEHHRHGDYCTAHLKLGHSPIHADDDYVIRCDCYVPKIDQLSLFEM